MSIKQRQDAAIKALEEKLKNSLPATLPDDHTGAIYCDYCNNYGMIAVDVPVGHDKFGKLFPCPKCDTGLELKRRQTTSQLQNAGVPKRFHEYTFDYWTNLAPNLLQGKQAAAAAAWEFVSAEGYAVNSEAYENVPGIEPRTRNSLVLYGDYGYGKTALACTIANELALKRKTNVLFLTAHDLYENVKQAMQEDSDHSTYDVILGFQKMDVLIIDGLDSDHRKDYKIDVYEQIIRYRCNNLMPTVITTNCTPQNVGMWGERTRQSLLEMAHWLEMAGAPLRMLDV